MIDIAATESCIDQCMGDSDDQSRVQGWGSIWKVVKNVINYGDKIANIWSAWNSKLEEEGDDAEVKEFYGALRECARQCAPQ